MGGWVGLIAVGIGCSSHPGRLSGAGKTNGERAVSRLGLARVVGMSGDGELDRVSIEPTCQHAVLTHGRSDVRCDRPIVRLDCGQQPNHVWEAGRGPCLRHRG
jgi:hypothetical protein